MKAAIVADKLTRDFGSLRALDSLTMEIREGAIFGFLGPNGAGKTTTISLLLGLLAPTFGNAQVLGFDIQTQSDEIRTSSGALLENTGLYEQLSASDNLEFYGRVWKIAPSELRSRIKELLTQMGLWERRSERVVKWSKGMKQKLALARALLHRPRLVFLDEPTAGLDVIAATAIREDLAALANQEGMTFFLTTHNMAEAEKLCHEVAVIRRGKLLAMGKPNELNTQISTPGLEITGKGFTEGVLDMLRNQPLVTSVELHDSQLAIQLREDVETALLVNSLVSAGVQIDEVRRSKASLEEVFIKLVEEDK
jgi:ABC-2 type transport system ATP-binding protein